MKTIDVKVEKGSRVFTTAFSDGSTGSVKYPKWYSMMAEVAIGKSVYRIFPTGFWKFRYELIKDGKVVLTVKNNWSGYEITKSNDLERPLIMAAKGFFKSGYIIKNHKQQVLLEVASDFSWKKFQQDYKVGYADDFGNEELEKVLMLLAVYFCIQMQTAAASAG